MASEQFCLGDWACSLPLNLVQYLDMFIIQRLYILNRIGCGFSAVTINTKMMGFGLFPTDLVYRYGNTMEILDIQLLQNVFPLCRKMGVYLYISHIPAFTHNILLAFLTYTMLYSLIFLYESEILLDCHVFYSTPFYLQILMPSCLFLFILLMNI